MLGRHDKGGSPHLKDLIANRKQILIVDDEEGIRFMLETKFSRSGFGVAVAANGLHALQKIRAKLEVDLIVCDLKMPGMTGLEFYKQVRELGIDTPILIITGYPEKRTLAQAAKLGVSKVLLKPVNQAMLMEQVEKIIQEKKSSDEPVAV